MCDGPARLYIGRVRYFAHRATADAPTGANPFLQARPITLRVWLHQPDLQPIFDQVYRQYLLNQLVPLLNVSNLIDQVVRCQPIDVTILAPLIGHNEILQPIDIVLVFQRE